MRRFSERMREKRGCIWIGYEMSEGAREVRVRVEGSSPLV